MPRLCTARLAGLLLLPLTGGCAFLDGGACTEEFRTYHVQVVDAADRPVEGLTSQSRFARTGEVLATSDDAPPGGFGYPVASDADRGAISRSGDVVLFTAEGRGLRAEATFEFYDDGCHVVQRAGPARIVAE